MLSEEVLSKPVLLSPRIPSAPWSWLEPYSSNMMLAKHKLIVGYEHGITVIALVGGTSI